MKIRELNSLVQEAFGSNIVRVKITLTGTAELLGRREGKQKTFFQEEFLTNERRKTTETIKNCINNEIGGISQVIESQLRREYLEAFKEAVLKNIDQAEINNLKEGKTGLFGLFGNKRWMFMLTTSLLRDPRIRKQFTGYSEILLICNVEITENKI